MKKFLVVCCCVCISSLFISCSDKKTTKTLEREDLFSLQYGNFENEINLSRMEQSSYSAANLCLNNGIFFLSNTVSKKILKTSFYGDLLSIYYNPQTNPDPDFYNEGNSAAYTQKAKGETESSDGKAASIVGTRTAVTYPFNNCTFLQATNLEYLYVVDTVPTERIQFDNVENIALMQVILHFDEAGNFVDYIGQEGLGGTPFPNIVSLSTNAQNDIIAVCKTPTSTKVFWFTSDGFLISKINLNNDSLPFPYEASDNFFVNIDAVFPSYETKDLFIKMDYYVEKFDSITGSNIGVNYDKSSIYKVSLAKGEFEHVQDVEAYSTPETEKTEAMQKVYRLMNVCKNDWAFLMTQSDTAYIIELLNLKTGDTKTFNLELENFNLLYSTFSVTNDCMLAGLFATEDKATISVWHIENFID